MTILDNIKNIRDNAMTKFISHTQNDKNKYIVLALLVVSAFLILFFVDIKSFSSSKVLITMSEQNKKTLKPKIYYAGPKDNLSEDKARKPYKNILNTYIFSIPSYHQIAQLRFDPDATPNKLIALKKILIVSNEFFHTKYYVADLKELSPIADIHDFKTKNGVVSFKTTGADPRLNIKLPIKSTQIQTNCHLDFFLKYILTVLLVVFLWHLSYSHQFNNYMNMKIILYALFFALILFKVFYYQHHIRIGHPPDELAHLAYVDFVSKNNAIIPKFENMQMVHNPKEGNYLSHPPLYYQIMAKFYNPYLNIKQNILTLRSISALLYVFAIMIIFYMGIDMKTTILGDLVFLTLISSIPMHAYIGASLSNDTLAILSAAICAFALKHLIEKQYTSANFALLGFSVLLAYFSKLTVALLVLLAIAYYAFDTFIIKYKFNKLNKKQLIQIVLILFLASIPICCYQLYIWFHYHGIRPSFKLTHHQEFLNSHFFVPLEIRKHLTIYEWYLRMKLYLTQGWFGIQSHHSLVKANWKAYSGLLFLHIFALFALFSSKNIKQNTYFKLGKYSLISLFSMLLIQFVFSYNNHLHNGYMGGLQARYSLPFSFSFAFLAACFVNNFKNFFWWNILVILICVHAIYSDFCYFILYYQ